MYTVYTIAIVSVAIYFWVSRRQARLGNVLTWSGKLELGGKIGFTAMIFGAIFLVFASLLAPQKLELANTVPLVAMRSTDTTNGVFVFGTGTVEGRLVYTIYARNSDNSITPYRIYAAGTRLIEDRSLKNQGTWKQYRQVVDDSWFLSGFVFDAYSDVAYNKHLFTVPVGTVVQEFVVR